MIMLLKHIDNIDCIHYFKINKSVHLKQLFSGLFVILMMCLLGILVLVFWSNLKGKIVNIIKNYSQIGLYKNEIAQSYK